VDSDIAYTSSLLEPTYTTPAASIGDVGPGSAKLHSEVPVAVPKAVMPLVVGTTKTCPAVSRAGAA